MSGGCRVRQVALARVACLAVVLSSGHHGLAGTEPALTTLEVWPAEVDLATRRDRQQLVVQATLADGVTRDVTSAAEWALADDKIATLESGTLRPVGDGETHVDVTYGGQTVRVPVKVASASVERPTSFKLDVVPVLSKSGCNQGSCHGAARGKDGFQLSLFGYDPDGDYQRLTREISARRINTALPDDSLVLEKAVARVPHSGGKLFDEQSELYATVRRWLAAGAPRDPQDVARPTAVEIFPSDAVLEGEGASQRLVVRARYSDGTTRDVTSLTFFTTSNERSAAVSPGGVVTAGVRGEAFIMARFDAYTTGVPVIVLPKALDFTFPEVPANNYVDELAYQKLRKLRISPSELCTDAEFLRRAYLDITGRLPELPEQNAFFEDERPDRRARLVDELLGRKDFVDLWVLKWAELLQIRSSNQVSYKAMLLYYNWLKERLAANVPIDRMVSELLSASGGTFRSPATNYYQNERDTLKVAENVAQVFLGMRIQCAQCHNHPFDRWKQDDYYGFAAFFSQIGRKSGEDPRETIVFNSGGGEVRHPVGNRVVAPKFLGGETPDLKGRDRRAAVAEWIASAENPYFARNLVNIVWAHFLGRGIVDQVDDVRVSNPPVNAELLSELARRFSSSGYDFRGLVRDICNSRTYQLATATNETNAQDSTNFSHASVRRLRAEVVLDVVSQVTETKNKFRGLPVGARAVEIADGRVSTYFLTTFGRASRETVCSCEVKLEPTLSQALHLLNGPTVTQNIRQGGLVARRLKDGKKPAELIDELYRRCLVRPPTAVESERLLAAIASEKNPQVVLEDIFWALLNSREFLFNH